MSAKFLSKKQQKVIKKDILTDINDKTQADIKKQVKKVSKKIAGTIQTNTDFKLAGLALNLKKAKTLHLRIIATLALLFILSVFFSTRLIHKKVDKEMAAYKILQQEELNIYKTVLANQLDSITAEYKEAMYNQIAKEFRSDSFKIFVTDITNKRFDDLAPEMIKPLARQYLETIVLDIKEKTDKKLDSIEKEIIKKQSELGETKSTAQVE